ncbi:hypothetical protein [Aestuariivirga sp.]|uniref:hypothetical protein n=1 Tax=Aestuariivirga sp. TaxID=2650926 RepID=UPI0039E4BAFA
MGNFYVHFTAETTDRDMVEQLLAGRNSCYFQSGRYIVIADELADSQLDFAVIALAQYLSAHLNTPVLAVRNHDDDILDYWLYGHGSLLDRYDSTPNYFEKTADSDLPLGGNASVLCLTYGCEKSGAVEHVLRADSDHYLLAFKRHRDLAKLLELPEGSVGFCYRYAQERSLPKTIKQEDVVFIKK